MDREPTNMDDIVDVRDVIARVEHLEDQVAPDENENDKSTLDPEEEEELRILHNLLDDLKGYGGDEQWRGDWYPITLIRDDYFTCYAEEYADDCGLVNSDSSWPNNHIDWEAAARDLQQDYSTVEWDGVTYWYR
jgi:hypothetical protein